MLGTKTGFTASLRWASSTRFSHIPTQCPPCFRHLEGKHKALLAPPGTCSALRASVISVSMVSCPQLSFQGPDLWSSPTHFALCSSNSPGQGKLPLICLKAVSSQRPFWNGKRKGALCYPACKDTCTWVVLEYSLYFQSPGIVFGGSPTTKPHGSHADPPPNSTLGSRPNVD